MRRIAAGLAVLGIVIIFAAAVAGDAYADGSARFLPPSAEHPFGTDSMGRDILTLIGSGIPVSDSMRSLPPIILALFLNALSGPGMAKIVAALSIGNMPSIARMCHARIAVLRTEGPAVAAECMGVSRLGIFIYHILPHLVPYLSAQCVSVFSASILTEASLSYLGCGVPPQLPSLGSMLADARGAVLTHPAIAIWPAAFLLAIGIALELVAKGIDDVSR